MRTTFFNNLNVNSVNEALADNQGFGSVYAFKIERKEKLL